MFFWKNKKEEVKEEKVEINPYAQDSYEIFSYTSYDQTADWNRANAIQHVPTGYAMDSTDSMAYHPSIERMNQDVLNYYIKSCSFIGYQPLALMGQHWLISKACKQKATDALRRWYELGLSNGKELTTDKSNKICQADKKMRLRSHLVQAVGFNNVFGIRHILFKHKNPNFDYEKPFNPDSFKYGEYEGISQIDPYWVMPQLDTEDMSDPISMSFYEPEYWLVKGRRIHKSHMFVMIGEEVADFLKPTYRYGGISLVQRIYERVYCAERTANESPKLVMSKRLNARKVDLAKAIANKASFMNNMMQANAYRDNHGWLIYGKDEEILQMETNLSQLAEVITNQYELVASIVDVPVSKLMGTGHKGFATGETDDDYYIASLESMQSDVLEEIILEHYKRLIPSLFNEDSEINIIWNQLKVMSDKEKADMNYVQSQTALNEFNIGAIDGYDERERIIQDKYSQYNGVESKSADELMPPEHYETPDNADGGGGSSKKTPDKKSANDPAGN